MENAYPPKEISALDKHNSTAIAADKQFDMSVFSLTGSSSDMEKQLLEDKFILGRVGNSGLAILGQSTVIYAAPNSGKTLLTLWMIVQSIKSGEINGDDVYYINADDDFKGFYQKLLIAEKYKFHMIEPGRNGFTPKKIEEYLNAMVLSGSAKGKVVIFDTLKKFVDLMNKGGSSELGRFVGEFIAHGGSVVALAHVNKNKDFVTGKSVYAGTSDISDDFSCVHILEVVGEDDSIRTVSFNNTKSRGSILKNATFSYSLKNMDTYLDLFDSVKMLSDEEVNTVQLREKLTRNNLAINAIVDAIRAGIKDKTKLVNEVSSKWGISKPKILTVLSQHNGVNYESGHRWTVTVGLKNCHSYELLSETKCD